MLKEKLKNKSEKYVCASGTIDKMILMNDLLLNKI